jgi:nucleoid-associated protein YgaU
MPLEEKEDIRFTMKLPQDISFPTDTFITESTYVPAVRDVEPAVIQSAEPTVKVSQPQEKTETRKIESPKPAATKDYIVADGDTLGAIAKKFYGPEEGNRLVNIKRLFEANRDILESIDNINVGQKLTIPSLDVSGPNVDESENSLPGAVFEKVVAIGRKTGILKAQDSSESGSTMKPPPRSNKTKPARKYIVQEGDTLSRIAAQQLGDSSRYLEIAKLNALKDPDTLEVGMQLKIPER